MIDISVIMAVHNEEEKFLRKAIDSILNQTYGNFEFIIVDDCSNIDTTNILMRYSEYDSRINVIQNDVNIGLTKSLNKALNIARGRYIARMDADDISVYERFEKQINYMEKHPQIDILGCISIDYETKRYEHGYVPYNMKRLKTRLLFENMAIPHPSAFIRRSFLLKYNIQYDESLAKSQDYGLWVECSEKGNIYALQEILLIKRNHPIQISCISKKEQIKCSHLIRFRQFKKLSSKITEKDIEIILDLVEGNSLFCRDQYIEVIKKIVLCNKDKRIYPDLYLEQELLYYLFYYIKRKKEVGNLYLLKILFPWNLIYIFKIRLFDSFMKKRIVKRFLKENLKYWKDEL